MTKALKIIALFFLAQVLGATQPILETRPMTDLVASKSRTFIITLLSGLIVASLFSGGIILTLIALALWMGTPTETTLWLLYVSTGLMIGSGLIMFFAFSKKRFERATKVHEERALSPFTQGAPQILEQILSALIKDLLREKPTTTAANTPIQSHPA